MLSNGFSPDRGLSPASHSTIKGPTSHLSMGGPSPIAEVAQEPEIEVNEEEMLEEEQKNKDAYTKMLIREELSEAQRANELEIEVLKDKVADTSRLDHLEGRVEELEILFKKFHSRYD